MDIDNHEFLIIMGLFTWYTFLCNGIYTGYESLIDEKPLDRQTAPKTEEEHRQPVLAKCPDSCFGSKKTCEVKLLICPLVITYAIYPWGVCEEYQDNIRIMMVIQQISEEGHINGLIKL